MVKTILEHFAELPDPRMERTKLHQLGDTLAIAICSVICGAEGWTDIYSKKRKRSKLASKANASKLAGMKNIF
jgi:hypothetical protein